MPNVAAATAGARKRKRALDEEVAWPSPHPPGPGTNLAAPVAEEKDEGHIETKSQRVVLRI